MLKSLHRILIFLIWIARRHSDAVRIRISSNPACFGESVCKADYILLISPIFTGCHGHVQLIKLSVNAPDPN